MMMFSASISRRSVMHDTSERVLLEPRASSMHVSMREMRGLSEYTHMRLDDAYRLEMIY